jgi:hypothetical protein
VPHQKEQESIPVGSSSVRIAFSLGSLLSQLGPLEQEGGIGLPF